MLIVTAAVLHSQTPKRQNQNFKGQRQPPNNNSGNNVNTIDLKKATEKFWEVRAEFDSADFQYAILLNDNAGLFAARQQGENKANFLKMVGHVGGVMKNSNLSNYEIAKLNLEIGQTCFALGRFVIANKRLLEAKTRFERSPAASNDYIETLGSLGLVYISMRRPKLADSFLLKATAMRENSAGSKDPGLIPLLNNRAVLDFTNGRYNKSEFAFDRAIGLLRGQLTSMA